MAIMAGELCLNNVRILMDLGWFDLITSNTYVFAQPSGGGRASMLLVVYPATAFPLSERFPWLRDALLEPVTAVGDLNGPTTVPPCQSLFWMAEEQVADLSSFVARFVAARKG
ncbi:hypothetical protein Nepgr_026804 [Nepenthes gracilis]|uniref:Uncharacterized protein n=1 Tax=Nepenthes gracilis TaxID=150966 RepID=A0AAD3Y2W2_NEPGR|nr:hypothetical protein Nepgr_026804 [Nepenthes gracilis]